MNHLEIPDEKRAKRTGARARILSGLECKGEKPADVYSQDEVRDRYSPDKIEDWWRRVQYVTVQKLLWFKQKQCRFPDALGNSDSCVFERFWAENCVQRMPF